MTKLRIDHGTANQAIEWVLEVNRDAQHEEFLRAWQVGDLSEWPEYYQWLEQQPAMPCEDWQPIETAPKGNEDDGPFFDVIWMGDRHPYLPVRRRRCDCYREGDTIIQKHGYPAVWTIFAPKPTHWMPSPGAIAAGEDGTDA